MIENAVLRKIVGVFGAMAFICFLANTVCATDISLSSLLDEMTNRSSNTLYPNYVCKQASSYDRASETPNDNWFANNDFSQFIRTEKHGEREEWVLMESYEPGVIVRWWITAPHYKNNFYIYIDGSTDPTFSGKIDAVVGGSFFADAPLSEETARGRNLYLPIPYSKSIKITCDGMEEQGNLYYQINYRTYPQNEPIESLTPEILVKQRDKITTACEKLLNPEKIDAESNGLRDIQEFSELLPPKGKIQSREEVSASGSACVTEIEVKLASSDVVQALRSVLLSIAFDGLETVLVPVGDFFGTGIGINPYQSWNSVVLPDGTMKAYWRMPFKREAQISFVNCGFQNVEISCKIFYEKIEWLDKTMYFHANWRQDREIETVKSAGTMDWNYTSIRGKGVYVGDVLSIVNPVEAWWGEGDEKIYVDGESFPSHFGTGTEDYYGYAWCTPQFFESPFHAQPRVEGPANYGAATNLRYRLLDGVPFASKLVFDMEIWHWEHTKIDYAVTTFWYGLPGTSVDGMEEFSRDKVEGEASARVFYNHKRDVKLSTFELDSCQTTGNISVQDMRAFEGNGEHWNESCQLWWTGGKVGDTIALKVPEVPVGKTILTIGTTYANDYGIVQFYWNGGEAGNPLDFYSKEGVSHGVIRLNVPKTKGEAGRLTIEIVGKNNNSVGEMFGIDYISWE